MSEESRSSWPLRIAIKTAGNFLLVWVLATYLTRFFTLTGGWRAIVIVGALVTLLNLLLRPVLAILTIPLKLFATVLAVIVVNGLIVWLIDVLVARMDPTLVTLTVGSGLLGWVIVAIVLGTGNWLLKITLK